MNHTLTEVLELRRFAEDSMETHLLEVNAASVIYRKKSLMSA